MVKFIGVLCLGAIILPMVLYRSYYTQNDHPEHITTNEYCVINCYDDMRQTLYVHSLRYDKSRETMKTYFDKRCKNYNGIMYCNTDYIKYYYCQSSCLKNEDLQYFDGNALELEILCDVSGFIATENDKKVILDFRWDIIWSFCEKRNELKYKKYWNHMCTFSNYNNNYNPRVVCEEILYK